MAVNYSFGGFVMKKSIYWLFALLTIAALLLSGCGTSEEATPVAEETEVVVPVVEEPAADIALKITGLVATEMAWTEAEVKAMEIMTVQSTNKDGEVKDYTGVSLNALLALAGVAADATGVVFVADDGYTAEVTLAELQACTDCIVSFRDQGGFSTVLPGFPGNVQVKGVVEIQVK
jgi:hypothetical protein